MTPNNAPDQSDDESEKVNFNPLAKTKRYPFGLTAREMHVIVAILQNPSATWSYLAALLVITENTIKTHVKSIYQKLNVCSKWEVCEKFKTIEFSFGSYTNATTQHKPQAFTMQLA